MKFFFNISQLITRYKSSSNMRNGLIFTLFAFGNNGVNFLIVMLLAGYLSKDGYGSLNLFNTTVLILTILVPLGTTSYIATSYFRKEKFDFKLIINSVFYIGTFAYLFYIVFSYIFHEQIESKLGLSFIHQLIAITICYFQLFTMINLEIWRLQEEPVKYGIYTIGIVLLNLLITAYFVIIRNSGWEGRIYAQLLVGALFFCISILFLFRKNIFVVQAPSLIFIKEALYFGMPLIPHMITGWMRQGVDRYIINAFWGLATVGVFSFAINISNIIVMVGTAFNSSNAVFIYKNLASREPNTEEKLMKQIKVMTIFFSFFAFIVFLFSYFTIPLVLPQYIDSCSLLLPLCLSAYFQCIYLLYVNFMFYYKRTKVLMCFTVSASLIHILLSYFFSQYSILCVAYVSLFSSFVIWLAVFLYGKKILKETIVK